jgi:hypothetical protein
MDTVNNARGSADNKLSTNIKRIKDNCSGRLGTRAALAVTSSATRGVIRRNALWKKVDLKIGGELDKLGD